MTATLFSSALIVKALLEIDTGVADVPASEQELLAITEEIRQAHLRKDARRFLAHTGASWLHVSDGRLDRRTREQHAPLLQTYLDSASLTSVRFVEPPRIAVSRDGSMAWVAAVVDVCGGTPARPIAFRSAFLHVYRREEGGWRRDIEASTDIEFAEACDEGEGAA